MEGAGKATDTNQPLKLENTVEESLSSTLILREHHNNTSFELFIFKLFFVCQTKSSHWKI